MEPDSVLRRGEAATTVNKSATVNTVRIVANYYSKSTQFKCGSDFFLKGTNSVVLDLSR